MWCHCTWLLILQTTEGGDNAEAGEVGEHVAEEEGWYFKWTHSTRESDGRQATATSQTSPRAFTPIRQPNCCFFVRCKSLCRCCVLCSVNNWYIMCSPTAVVFCRCFIWCSQYKGIHALAHPSTSRRSRVGKRAWAIFQYEEITCVFVVQRAL